MEEDYDGLALGGGAHKGIGQLGMLKNLFDHGVLKMDKLRYFSGTSIGSVIGLLLITGYTPDELYLAIYRIDNFLQVRDLEDKTIWSVFGNHGFMDIKCITREVEALLLKKMPKIPTFIELKEKTGKSLYIPASNLSRMEITIFSPETTPFMSCLKAVELSSNLPFIFSMNTYQGEVFVDGGLGDNFPYKCLEGKAKKLFGIVCSRTDDSNNIVGEDQMQIFEYVRRAMLFPIQTIQNIRIREALSCNHDVARVDMSDIPFFQINPTKEIKRKMFVQGYQQGELHRPLAEFYVVPLPKTCLTEKEVQEERVNEGGDWGSFEPW